MIKPANRPDKSIFMQSFLYSTSEDVRKKTAYDAAVERDRSRLLSLQFALRDAGVPVIILLSGGQTSGYTRVMNLLNEWMDTRFIETHVHRPDSDEEADRPYFWKYWRQLPGQGSTGLFVGGWYTQPYLHYLHGRDDVPRFHQRLESIAEMEQLLAVDGALIIKIWLHLEEEDKKLNKKKSTNNRPEDTWQVTMDDWRPAYSYKEKAVAVEQAMRLTSTPHAPWYAIDASDSKQCDVSVMQLLCQTFEQFQQRGGPDTSAINGKEVEPAAKNHIENMDLSPELKRKKYHKKMNKYWEKLYIRAWKAHQRKESLVIVLEGSDAAGKGGAIRRLIRCLDARLYRVIQIAAPTRREKAQHYLWRFWMQIPRAGFITVYDRSWYGRVLVERVEGFAEEEEWKRAYAEINHFERQLYESGTRVLKFWLQISKEEQLDRFRKREQTEHKQHKLTEEDWRNREKWDEYQQAVNDMIEHTSTDQAPWHLVPAEDKKYARIEVLKQVNKALKR